MASTAPIELNDPGDLGRILAEMSTGGANAYLQIVRKIGSFIGIGLLDGMIVYLQCGSAEGASVTPSLGQIRPGDKLLIWPPRENKVSSTLPDPAEVFAVLKTPMPATDHSGAILQILDGAMPSVAPTPAQPRSETDATIDRGRLLAALQPVVRQHLGPIADFLLEDALQACSERVSADETTLILHELARDVPDVARSRALIAAAQAAVAALFVGP